MHKPVIGITTSQKSKRPEPNETYSHYFTAVKNAGGEPRMIGLAQPLDELDVLIAGLDGLILSGGGDVQTRLYHGDETLRVELVSQDRDVLELELIHKLLATDLPLLGICRGAQMINVALGGTLITDIPTQRKSSIQHSYSSKYYPRNRIAHEVSLEPGSRLASIYGTARISVNSRHHQAILEPADEWQVAAHAPDGLIEALELPGPRFAVGVQWHPENLQDMPGHQNLFKAFIAAAGVK